MSQASHRRLGIVMAGFGSGVLLAGVIACGIVFHEGVGTLAGSEQVQADLRTDSSGRVPLARDSAVPIERSRRSGNGAQRTAALVGGVTHAPDPSIEEQHTNAPGTVGSYDQLDTVGTEPRSAIPAMAQVPAADIATSSIPSPDPTADAGAESAAPDAGVPNPWTPALATNYWVQYFGPRVTLTAYQEELLCAALAAQDESFQLWDPARVRTRYASEQDPVLKMAVSAPFQEFRVLLNSDQMYRFDEIAPRWNESEGKLEIRFAPIQSVR